MRKLIVSGDDFGLDVRVNEAIEIAHKDGILTTTSLMMSGEATADAIERARRLPGLAVGFTTTYVAEIPGGTVARCNPVLRPVGCVDAELDTIYTPKALPSTTTTSAPGSTTTTVPSAPGAQPVSGTSNFTG